MALEVEIHDAVEPLEEEWDHLAERVHASPFSRPGWIREWVAEFGAGDLALVAVRDGGELRAVLPLERDGNVLRAAAGDHTPLFEIAAAGRADAAAAVRAAMRMGTRRLELRELDAEGLTAAALAQAAAEEGWRLREKPMRAAPVVRLGSDPDAYPAALSGRKRRDLARRRRKLEGHGEVTVEWLDGHDRLAELLAEGFAVEGSGWKDDQGTAITSSAGAVRFYAAISRWAAAQGYLRLGFIRLDGAPLAFQLTLWDGAASWMLKGGFVPEHRQESPGVLMLAELVARSHSLGLDRVELLGDDEPYKRHFARHTRTIVRAQAFATTLSGHLDRAAESYARPLARKLAAAGRA